MNDTFYLLEDVISLLMILVWSCVWITALLGLMVRSLKEFAGIKAL